MSIGPSILFIGEFAGFYGGIERYMYRTAQLLRAHGFLVCGLFDRDSRDAEAFKKGFDQVWQWDQLGEVPPIFELAAIHKVRSPLQLHKFRARFRTVMVVHDHDYYCPRRCRYWPVTLHNCTRSYSPLVCGVCGMTRRPDHGLFQALRENFLLAAPLWYEVRAADRLVVLSHFMRDTLVASGADPAKIQTLPPAIESHSEEELAMPEPDAVPHLITVGQLIRGKGVDQLLTALPLIRGRFVLDIVGAGNAEAALREQAAPFGEQVIFHGWSQTPEELYRRASIAVLPWRWQEPFGLVGPEAQSYGLPLVGFNRGGIGEYLVNEKTGLLVEPEDPEALAKAISRLLASPELAAKLGRAGRTLVRRKFAPELFVRAWKNLVSEVNA